MVDRQQQALLPVRAIDQYRAQQRPCVQIEAALRVVKQPGAVLQVRHAGLPQQRLLCSAQVLRLPLTAVLLKAQAQGVVMHHQGQQRPLQQGRLKRFGRLQQHALVPVPALRHVGIKEPLLNRRQCRFASEYALFSGHLLGLGRNARQRLHGLMLEQVTGAEVNPQLPGAADHLNRQDRVAAQLEKVVIEADMFKVQHLAPHLGQTGLQRIARGHVVLAIELNIGRRQGAAVEFAVGGQRHAVQQHQVRGHHVIRQLRLEPGLERFAQRTRLGLFITHQPGRQLLATRHVQRQHHGFTYRRMPEQVAFDLAQFDAKTPDFDLMIDPPQVFHQTVSALAHQVAGAVQAPAIARKRVCHKAFGRQPGTLVIPLRQPSAADVQFAGGALGHQRQMAVENVGHPRTDDLTDWHTGGTIGQLFRCQAGQRHDHGFGRAVGIEKHARLEGRTDALQVLAGQCFAAGDAHAHRQCLPAAGQPLGQLAAVAGGEAQNTDLLLTDQLADCFGVPLPLRPQHQPRTTEQRHQQTLGGSVEVDRIKVQFTVIRTHAKPLNHRLAMHGDFAVGHHHAFGLAGGARGVDQIRLMLWQIDKRQVAGRVRGQLRAVVFETPAHHA